jgi:hypothetical protein
VKPVEVDQFETGGDTERKGTHPALTQQEAADAALAAYLSSMAAQLAARPWQGVPLGAS